MDDVLLLNNCEKSSKIKEELSIKFSIKDLDRVKSLLGIRIRKEKV